MNISFIQLTYKKFIPVYLHNLKGYDSHLFVSGLCKYGYKDDSNPNDSCISNNEEKYISFSKMIKVDEFYKMNKETKNMKKKM